MPKIKDEATKDVIISGDYISVELDGEVFKMMQTDEHGGWSDGMTLVSNAYSTSVRKVIAPTLPRCY